MRKTKRRIKNHFRKKGGIYLGVMLVLAVVVLALWAVDYVAKGDDAHVQTVATLAGTSEQKYQNAQDLLAKGDKKAAKVVMLRLARLGEPGKPALGYGKAHFWVAKDMLPNVQSAMLDEFPFPKDPKDEGESVQKNVAEVTERAKQHLQHAVELNPELKEAWAMLAALYLNAGERNKAVLTLLDAVSHESSPHPELHVKLANARAQRGDELGLNERMLHEFSSLGQQLGFSGNQAVSLRVRYLTSALILGKYENANIALRRLEMQAKHRQTADAPSTAENAQWARAAYHYHRAIAEARKMGSSGYESVVDQLERCVTAAPTCQAAAGALLVISKRDAGQKDRIFKLMRKVSEQAKSADLKLRAKMLLQLDQVEGNTGEKSKVNLEKAIKLDPENGEALIALADIVFSEPAPDYRKVQGLVEKAMQHLPGVRHGECHRLLGGVQLRQKQWAKAIVSLEKALAHGVTNKEVHGWLAQAYSSMGQEKMAAAHEVLAED